MRIGREINAKSVLAKELVVREGGKYPSYRGSSADGPASWIIALPFIVSRLQSATLLARPPTVWRCCAVQGKACHS
jgi:hypothetical protein